jgi:hypothetical protein
VTDAAWDGFCLRAADANEHAPVRAARAIWGCEGLSTLLVTEPGGCDALPLTFPTEQVDEGLVSPAGLDRKGGQGGAVVGAVEGGALVDGAGEEAAAEGAVRHEPDAQLLTDRQHALPIGFGAVNKASTTPFPLIADRSRGERRGLQRNEWNAARNSSENSCGCSQAAKWPPFSASLK